MPPGPWEVRTRILEELERRWMPPADRLRRGGCRRRRRRGRPWTPPPPALRSPRGPRGGLGRGVAAPASSRAASPSAGARGRGTSTPSEELFRAGPCAPPRSRAASGADSNTAGIRTEIVMIATPPTGHSYLVPPQLRDGHRPRQAGQARARASAFTAPAPSSLHEGVDHRLRGAVEQVEGVRGRQPLHLRSGRAGGKRGGR